MSATEVKAAGDDKKDKALISLLTNPSISRASRAAGVSRTLIMQWCREDTTFIAALAASKQCVVADTVGALKVASRLVVDELTRIALKGKRECDRVSACRAVLDHVIPRKQEVVVKDESAQWDRVLGELSADSAEFRVLLRLSERLLGSRIDAIPVTGETIDTTAAPGSAETTGQVEPLPGYGDAPRADNATGPADDTK